MDTAEIKRAVKLLPEEIWWSDATLNEYRNEIRVLVEAGRAVLAASECLPNKKPMTGKDIHCFCDGSGDDPNGFCDCGFSHNQGYNEAINLCTATLAKKLVGLEEFIIENAGQTDWDKSPKSLATAITNRLGGINDR